MEHECQAYIEHKRHYVNDRVGLRSTTDVQFNVRMAPNLGVSKSDIGR